MVVKIDLDLDAKYNRSNQIVKSLYLSTPFDSSQDPKILRAHLYIKIFNKMNSHC